MDFVLIRMVHPIGQGGFVSETVLGDGFTVVFDCGSKTKDHEKLLVREINRLKGWTDHIETLVISHFDEDHYNGLSLLVSSFPIREVIVPSIPKEFRRVYDSLTGGAY